MMFSLARAAIACSEAALNPATCGVSTTCSSRRSGPSGSGSTSNTSSAAPPSWPAWSASTSAASSTRPPGRC